MLFSWSLSLITLTVARDAYTVVPFFDTPQERQLATSFNLKNLLFHATSNDYWGSEKPREITAKDQVNYWKRSGMVMHSFSYLEELKGHPRVLPRAIGVLIPVDSKDVKVHVMSDDDLRNERVKTRARQYATEFIEQHPEMDIQNREHFFAYAHVIELFRQWLFPWTMFGGKRIYNEDYKNGIESIFRNNHQHVEYFNKDNLISKANALTNQEKFQWTEFWATVEKGSDAIEAVVFFPDVRRSKLRSLVRSSPNYERDLAYAQEMCLAVRETLEKEVPCFEVRARD